MGACGLKKLCWNLKQKLNKINKDSLFIFVPSSRCVKIARWHYSGILLIKVIKESKKKKKRIKRKSNFFPNSFSVDQINVFFRVALSPLSDKKRKTLQPLLIFHSLLFLCWNIPFLFWNEMAPTLSLSLYPSLSLCIFQTQFAKVSSLEIFFQENIFS